MGGEGGAVVVRERERKSGERGIREERRREVEGGGEERMRVDKGKECGKRGDEEKSDRNRMEKWKGRREE